MTAPNEAQGAALRRAYLALEQLQSRLAEAERARHEPIAVIGVGCRFPGGADNPAAFWRLLRDGADAIVEVPRNRWDVDAYYDPDPAAPGKTSTRWGGFLGDVDRFDARFFGLAPREAISLDPQQRLLLEVAWEALEDAGQAPDRLAGTSTGVFVGIASSDYAQLQQRRGQAGLDAYYASGIAHSMAAGRLSYVLGLQGPSLALDTACSSSLVAIHLACQSLRNHECRLALAGGVHVALMPDSTIAFSRARMLAPDGRCKAFDAAADGFVEGEGCGIVVLKRLADAQADGDPILAVIRGSAINQDGASAGLTAPSGKAQEMVLRDALTNARLSAADVAYVEAHGTGTSLGDPIEVRALASVLGEGHSLEKPLLLGSVKTNIGHLEAAAGVASVIKVVLALRHAEIPAHLHLKTLNPHVAWDEIPVRVVTAPRAWPSGRRVAGVSSFGFSGTNVHVLLEEAPADQPADTAPSTTERPVQVLTLGAKSQDALRALARRWAGALAARDDVALADAAFTANLGRARLEYGAALVASSMDEAVAKLEALAGGTSAAGLVLGRRLAAAPPKLAFLFTGQGAQYPGMGRELYDTEPVFRAALERCATALDGELDRPLLDLLHGTDGTQLEQTGYTQPALFALEWALAELWRAWGVEPAVVLGHSVGEYVAACVAGVFEVEEAARLIAARGRLMQRLPAGGAMAAALASEERVRQVIAATGNVVEIAAVNGPANVVLSGAQPAVQTVVAALTAAGIRTEALRVSHAFHSALMEPMLEAFREAAAAVKYRRPRLPVVSNVTGEIVRGSELSDPEYWVRHVRQSVLFAAGMSAAERAGVNTYVEIGPHPVLAGLGAQCVGQATWVPSLRRGRGDVATLLDGVARVWAAGVAVDWAGFGRGRSRRKVPGLPTYPFERERYWVGPPAQAADVAPEEQPRPGGHPLLGTRLRSPLSAVQFESLVTPEAPAFIGDHRIGGACVVPATAYVEMAAAAAHAVRPGAHCLVDIALHEALVLPDDRGRRLQLVLQPDERGARSFQIFALADAGSGTAETEWKAHASGRMVPALEPAPSVALDEARARCAEPISREVFYARFDGTGIELGPAFRAVQSVWRRDGEAVGEIRLPEALVEEIPAYRVHPVLLDACVQVIAAALPSETTATYLPFGIDRFQLWQSPGATAWTVACLRDDGGTDTLAADVHVVDDGGRVVAALQGFRLKRVERAALARVSSARLMEWIHEVAWRPAPPATTSVGAEEPFPVEPGVIVARVGAEAAAARRDPALARYDLALPALERLCVAHVVDALRSLGVELRVGVALAPVERLERYLGTAPKHRRLLARLLEILTEEGLLEVAEEGWRVVREPATTDTAALERELRASGDAVAAEVEFVHRCGPRLAEVLRGACDPLQLLFPDGSLAAAEALYHDSPPARVYGDLAAEALRTVVAGLPARRRLRVLEIGGGTGGTTRALLPVLPADRTEYVFSDVSPLFTARADERFASHQFFRSRLLDIDADPVAQGLSPGGFDVIVAANVLHATTDLTSTVERCRALLAPGGVLLLLEVTVSPRWVDVTFGLTDGWWKYSDVGLRGSCPLLSAAQWQSLLHGVGFGDVHALPAPSPGDGVLARQALLIARAPTHQRAHTTPSTGAPWIIFADGAGVGDRLAVRLRARGERCVVARAGTDYAAVADTVTLDPAAPAHVQRLFADALAAGGRCAGVVHLWALDAPADDDAAVLDRAPLRTCGSILHAVQALVAAAPSSVPRLWLVTRGAQALGSGPGAPAASQAPVWGLGRTIALEHPELGCVCVDLDPVAGPDDADALLAEMSADGGETQVALRASGRYVARLVRAPRGPATPAALAVEAVRLERSPSGSLDALTFDPIARRAPSVGEVEIRVRASGLNFKDVLNALGMYPGVAGPLGSECAGVVTAVGPGVTALHPGQDVIALAAGTLASYVTTPGDFVVPKPATLTFEQAATLPIAFVTAQYALSTVGRMRGGERVLVHAAAGGVGLAAVRLAQRAGLEVFATAGSAEKREFLRAQGVQHVFDSRTLGFDDEIHARTGGRGVDLVLNSLSGAAIERTLRVLAPGGRFLEIGKRGIWSIDQIAAARPDVEYTVIDWGEVARATPAVIRGVLLQVLEDVTRGGLTPLPLAVFSASEVQAAFRHMAQARHIGKIAIAPPAVTASGRTDVVIAPEATYLVTGGLGGLGLEVARWLLERGARSLVLMGRRPPSPSAAARVDALREAGAEVMVVAGDVARAQDLERVIAEIARTPRPLRGVFHAAGALDDGVLMQQNLDRFAAVMAAKVDGAWNLHRATRHLPLDLFVLFSSVAAVLGSPGQANHAAANAFLDALAHQRRADGLPGLSIAWGAWSEVGAAAEDRVIRRIATQGIGTIAPEEGLLVLELLLDSGATHAAVLPVDWPSFLGRFAAGRAPSLLVEVAAALPKSPAAEVARAGLLEQLRSAPVGQREPLLIDHIVQRVARVLGLDASHSIDSWRPLKELGIDSLMAVELRNVLKADLGLEDGLPATLVFDHPTVEAIARFVLGQVFGQSVAAAAPPSREEAEDVVDRIEHLSDEEVDRLLSRRLGGER